MRIIAQFLSYVNNPLYIKLKRGQYMKVIIIGGVAAGTKAAAKIKRGDRSAQVDIYTKEISPPT